MSYESHKHTYIGQLVTTILFVKNKVIRSQICRLFQKKNICEIAFFFLVKIASCVSPYEFGAVSLFFQMHVIKILDLLTEVFSFCDIRC